MKTPSFITRHKVVWGYLVAGVGLALVFSVLFELSTYDGFTGIWWAWLEFAPQALIVEALLVLLGWFPAWAIVRKTPGAVRKATRVAFGVGNAAIALGILYIFYLFAQSGYTDGLVGIYILLIVPAAMILAPLASVGYSLYLHHKSWPA